jgi:3-oxoadipate enol-lactonase
VLRGAAMSDLPSPEALRQIRRPTLVLAWETDPGHPLSSARLLAHHVRGSRLAVASTSREVRRWPEAAASFLREVSP